jgi:Protein of unknown function (DUF2937)
MFFAAWLLHSIRLAAALAMALLAMQAPAITREYQAALLQLVRSSDQEIAQRKASAQRFYGIAPEEDEGRFLARLRAVEPSNAETLSAALERERSLQASYDRIEHSPDLLRPIIAAKDVAAEDGGSRRQIAQTAFHSFAPQLDLSFAAAVYGLAGLFLGSLIGELLTALYFVAGTRSRSEPAELLRIRADHCSPHSCGRDFAATMMWTFVPGVV